MHLLRQFGKIYIAHTVLFGKSLRNKINNNIYIKEVGGDEVDEFDQDRAKWENFEDGCLPGYSAELSCRSLPTF